MIYHGFGAPVVASRGRTGSPAPLVVLLHGHGCDEQRILRLTAHLPADLEYLAVRAPIDEGGAHAWFLRGGSGWPVTASLRSAMDWFRGWLSTVVPPGRPVVLVGCGSGAVFAGGLLLDDPARYAGAALLQGPLPFRAGVPVEPDRLAGVPVFVACGQDPAGPGALLDRTWTYLTAESGARARSVRHADPAPVTPEVAAGLGSWLACVTGTPVSSR